MYSKCVSQVEFEDRVEIEDKLTVDRIIIFGIYT